MQYVSIRRPTKNRKDLHRYYLKNPSKFYKKSRFANDRIITYNLAKGQFEENIQKILIINIV